MDKILVAETRPGIRLITLNRPDALNSFDHSMYGTLLDILWDIKSDLSARVVIITGAGRAFCAGHDTRNPGQSPINPAYGKFQRNKLSLNRISQIPPLLRSMPQPVIAAVNGAAAGIGYALALAADMIIAGSSAKFVNAIHNAGTGAELGLSYLLPRAVGTQKAAEILFTARPIAAQEAERIGLVLQCVPDDELLEAAYALAADICVNTPLGIYLTKQALWQNMNAGSLEAAIELEGRGVQISQATEDAAEKRRSATEKRLPKFNNS